MADPKQTAEPEPVDAEFEPARDLPDRESEGAARKGVGGATVTVLFLIATLAGGGLGFAGARYWPAASTSETGAANERAALTQSITGLDDRLTAMEAESPALTAEAALAQPMAAINARLDALESAPTGASPDLTTVEARLAALENTVPADDTTIAGTAALEAIAARIEATERDLANLNRLVQQASEASASGDQNGVDPLLLQNLSDRLAELEAAHDVAAGPVEPVADPQTAVLAGRIEQLETALNETRALAEAARSTAETAADSAATRPASSDTGQASRQLAARALALSALRDIAGTHQGFEAERAALAQLWRGNADLAAMAAYARAGVPTLDDLTADYPGDAIRDAAGPGRIFFGLIEVRQANPGTADTGAMAISALAENRLALRDLEGAVALTERLDETSLPAARDWLIGAQARLDLDRRLVALRQALTEAAAAQGDDPS
ncbi:coiled-coil domain-containing protein [Maricaulis salignorans]|uniref:Inner membrane protein n=1 Tax=Maricaulis salignorans TaxID=144026 RepID=A0A1G9SWQ6_9PROT|nr:hypothetical protein [Maricaulis salignorans]SDM39889.1 hypothetical protein SAMN04488568_110100 [Maricaulis salignorans]